MSSRIPFIQGPIPHPACSVRFDFFRLCSLARPFVSTWRQDYIGVRLDPGDETLSPCRSAPKPLLFLYYLYILRACSACATWCFVPIFGPLMSDLHARTLLPCARLYLSSFLRRSLPWVCLSILQRAESVPCATRSLSTVCPLSLVVFTYSPTPDACRFCCSRWVRRPPFICGDRDALPGSGEHPIE